MGIFIYYTWSDIDKYKLQYTMTLSACVRACVHAWYHLNVIQDIMKCVYKHTLCTHLYRLYTVLHFAISN